MPRGDGMDDTLEITICPLHMCRNDSTLCGLYGTWDCPVLRVAQDLKRAEEAST